MTTHILNFQPRFAELVATGAKRQTIRPLRAKPIKPGSILRLQTGARVKGSKVRLLGFGRVVQVAPVVVYDWHLVDFTLKRYPKEISMIGECHDFAVADGFSDWYEFRGFFKARYRLPFNGVLIRWELDPKRGKR